MPAIPVNDTYTAPAGTAVVRFGNGGLGIALGFDGANPDHICLRCPITGAVPEGTRVRVQHKTAGTSTWRDGMFLHRVRLSELVGMPAAVAAVAVNAFCGMVFAPAAASTTAQAFDVRLAIYPPGDAPVQYVTGTHSLRPLVAAAPAVTHNCTPANFAAVLASLPHQSGAPVHLRMAAGTYNWTAQAWAKGGTSAFPLYVSAASLGDVIINTPTGDCLLPQSSYVVMEKLRFTGSGVDSGTAATSQWLAIPGGAAAVRDWTVRDCEVLGFDVGAKSFEAVQNFDFRRVLFNGNNTWALAFQPNGWGGTYNNATWNDHGICLPGVGNSAAYCTIKGFGDSWRTYAAASWKQWTAGCGMSWCDVRNSGDDMAELDGTCGNSYVYECRGVNVGNGVSADDTYGPAWVIKPLIINPSRGPWKLTSDSFGVVVVNATVVMTVKGPDDHGMLVPYGGTQRDFVFVNCATHYAGAGNALHWSSQLARDRWANNAWFPDRGFYISTAGSYANLAAAKAGSPARFVNDVLLGATPFASAITLGANTSIEYVGNPTGQLAAGNAARNAGVPYAGVTDGFTGAAPDIGCVISGQPLAQYGVPAASALPTWVPAASTTHATVTKLTVANGGLANTSMSVCAPYYDDYWFGTTWAAYGGGRYNPWWGAFGAMLFFGQGHANGNNNQVVALEYGQQCTFRQVNMASPIFGTGTDGNTRFMNAHGDFSYRPFPNTQGLAPSYVGQVLVDQYTAQLAVDGQCPGMHSYNLMTVLEPSAGAPSGTFFIPMVAGGAYNVSHIDTQSVTSYEIKLDASAPQGSRLWEKLFSHPTYPAGIALSGYTAAPSHTMYDPESKRVFIESQNNFGPRWYDRNGTTATAAFVQGTGTALNRSDYASGSYSHMGIEVPSRRLAVMFYKKNTGFLAAKWMDMSAAQPSWVNTGANITQNIPLDQDWCCVCWCEPIGSFVVGDISGNRSVLAQIALPAVLTDPWVVEMVPTDMEITGWEEPSNRTSDNANVYRKFHFVEELQCIPFLNHKRNLRLSDELFAIRPKGVV